MRPKVTCSSGNGALASNALLNSLRSKLVVALSIPLVVVALIGGVLAWGTWRARVHVERDNAHYAVLEAYLQLALARNEYLLSQVRELGQVEQPTTPVEAQEALDRALAHARAVVGPDSATSPSEERRRFQLAEIQQAFSQVDRALDTLVEQAAGNPNGAPELADVAQVLVSETKLRLGALVERAIADERTLIVADLGRESWWLTFVFVSLLVTALLTLVIAAGLAWRAALGIEAPVEELLKATERIARSDFSKPATVASPVELAYLGQALNRMAERLQTKRKQLVEVNQNLERQVAERTHALEQANAQLNEENTRRRQLFAELSHELRTPITVIRGEAEVTLRTEGNGNYRESLWHIVEQAQHTGRLLEDLLLLARGEAADLPLEQAPVEVSEFLRRVHGEINALAAKKNQRFRLELPKEPVVVSADEQRLRQVLMILLDNACRYTQNDGMIELSMTVQKDHVEVSVQDNGSGIPPEEMPRVFDRFFRGRLAQEHAPNGSGLGLSVARFLVEQHKGTLTLNSHVGVGTQFTIRLRREEHDDDARFAG